MAEVHNAQHKREWQQLSWASLRVAAHHMAPEQHGFGSASHGHRASCVQQRITWPQSAMGAAAHHMAPERHGCGSASHGPRASWVRQRIMWPQSIMG